jgi:hypothetical protein
VDTVGGAAEKRRREKEEKKEVEVGENLKGKGGALLAVAAASRVRVAAGAPRDARHSILAGFMAENR